MRNLHQTIRYQADCFCIWREGNPIGWDCTAMDLADATGLPVRRVRDICRDRGWTPSAEPALGGHGVTSVDREIGRAFG